MLKIKEILVVEGKYDQIRLSSLVDGVVVTTNGFRIFKDKEQIERLRSMAATRGVLVLTDSDSAGLVIRNYVQNALPGIPVRHAYIPPVKGKERRKAAPSKEGLLGVEGMDEETLRQALLRAGPTVEEAETDAPASAGITKARLYADGLSGRADSAARRERFCRRFGLPTYLSADKLLDWINCAMTAEDYAAAVKDLREE